MEGMRERWKVGVEGEQKEVVMEGTREGKGKGGEEKEVMMEYMRERRREGV